MISFQPQTSGQPSPASQPDYPQTPGQPLQPPLFGEPQDDEPVQQRKVRREYWDAVVRHAKANHGQWIPLLNPQIARTRRYNIVDAMKSKRPSKEIPVPLREEGMQARMAKGTFYFRYDKPQEGYDD